MGIVRIPLDYYRILGLPIQATAEQLQQAHRDRTQQLPRREFSDAAIDARKELIDEAYAILSDLAQRQDYDAGFLAKSYELLEVGRSDLSSEEEMGSLPLSKNASNSDAGVDPYTPSVEIQESQFIGALLILLELGEYELVLKLGRPYLSSGNFSIRNGNFGDPDIVSADIVLTVAFACLELGREQWQQGQYENAAESLETGQELLLREGIFANIRGEMQADLFKLRPYRILELLALPVSQAIARRQGLSLLEDMLQDRGGIDGTGDDQSGLSVDDFLRFIQQLRSYLTAAEQQTLFEAESRRPSAVATYLAVYGLLARGFAERQPALIRRAKSMLVRLGTRQDVHLEQAVCALLLGQTEEASRALELSQEFESLVFIREHSQESPDLLPGLCLYSERWLQTEVFPHFRDLARKQASLKEYFADEGVQAYLEELPNEPEATPHWKTSQPAATYRQPATRTDFGARSDQRMQVGQRVEQGIGQGFSVTSTTATMEPDYAVDGRANANGAATGATARSAAELSTAERTATADSQNGARTATRSRQRLENRVTRGGESGRSPLPDYAYDQPNGTQVIAGDVAARRRTSGGRSLRLDRLLLLAALGLLSLVIVGALLSKLLRGNPQASQAVASEAEQVKSLQPILSDFASKEGSAIAASGPLTTANAPALVEAWLAAKSAALGESHDTSQLDKILVDPALSEQQARAEEIKTSNSYWKYDHSNLQIISVETSQDNPDQAMLEASLSEKGDLYTDGKLDKSSSYDSSVKVRYSLLRQDGQWHIRDWQVE